MALSDLAVYSEYAYTAMTETLDQQVGIFNQATQGAIVLSAAAHQGDYSDAVLWSKINGLVRRRNAYGSGAVAEKNMQHLVDTMVKVAAGTPPIRLDPGQFKWIQQNPQVAGAALGQQLAKDTMADMLNTSLGACVSALSGVAAVSLDITGVAAPSDKMNFNAQNQAQSLFGDSASDLVAWVMYSKQVFDLYGNAIANANNLFTYGTVRVVGDPMGRPMVMTDSPSLYDGASNYYSLLLSGGAISVDQNNDFTANEETTNGDENIKRTYQAEWSYELGLKGFTWDKASGGKSPTDAAIFASANWDQYATSHKDLAGVVVKSH